MKKIIPYILLSLVAAALIGMFMTGAGKKKRIDERITFRKKDKIPYGTWVAFRSLPAFFPRAAVYTSRQEPGYWDSISVYDSHQLFIAITPRFMPDEYEMRKLITFVENGNDVFISTVSVSNDLEEQLDCKVFDVNRSVVFDNEGSLLSGYDSLLLYLKSPPYATRSVYKYPGKNLDGSFTKFDSLTSIVLGNGEMNDANFIHLKAGRGNFYLHLAPMAFTNYFLLHKNNMEYFEKLMSVIDPAVEKIVWDEYYLNKRYDRPREKKKSWISVLFKYPALKAALLTAIFTLLLYLLLGMRRKQRYIPVVKKPKNDSLDFVKTIGRLYYDKSDHKNLCRKMATYFLEYVRTKYKMATGTLDEMFIRNLQFKSDVPEAEVRHIISFIKYIDDAPQISPGDVTTFYQQLESFYKKA
ncbi:MAG TPA: hypothetical protein VMZ03_13705 [Chitinophagaceae bacterium]|nr:hypothetical protein [Chitinophagaceae bacterium]